MTSTLTGSTYIAHVLDRKLAGHRIRLTRIQDQFTRLKKGDKGTVVSVWNDDLNIIRIGVNWDAGSTLSLLLEIDDFEVLN